MHKTIVSIISLIALITILPSQGSDFGNGLDLSANVSVTSDYVWRGDTQTDDNAAVQGGFDLSHSSGFYLGNWNSNITDGIEMDVYGGSSRNYGILKYDVGTIGYLYPKQKGLDFYELYAGLAVESNSVTPAIKTYYDPDNENTYTEGTLDLAVKTVTLTGRLGYNMPNEGDNLYDWGVGASFNALTVDWGVQYVDKESGEETVLFSIGKTF